LTKEKTSNQHLKDIISTVTDSDELHFGPAETKTKLEQKNKC
jgi:hypothetical protein